MIRSYGGNKHLGLHRRDALQLPGNPLRPLAVLGFHGGIVLAQKPIHRGNQADDFFLRHFHSATDGIRVRGIILFGGLDQIFSAQEQASTLRATQTFAARECHQIESHLRVIPQIRNRRNIRRRIIEARDPMLVGNAHPVFAADLAFTGIKKVGHNGVIVESLFVLFKCFHLDKANATISQRMVVSITMRFLNDYFVLKGAHVGRNIENGRIVSPRYASSSANHKRGSSASGDESGLATQALR